MRRLYILLFALFFTINAWSYTLVSVDENGTEVYYDILKGVARVVGISKVEAGTAVVISDYIEYEGDKYTVKYIADGAFQFSDIGSVFIPSTVQTIGSDAFTLCVHLEKVELNEGLKEIKTRAFSTCSSLTRIELPSTVKTIGERAFSGCKGLMFFTFCGVPMKVGQLVFKDCYNLNFLEIKAQKVPKSDNLKFPDLCGIDPQKCSIYVPSNMISSYNQGWGRWYTYKAFGEMARDVEQRKKESFDVWANFCHYVATPIDGTENVSLRIFDGFKLGVSMSIKDFNVPDEVEFLGRTYTVTVIDDEGFKGQKKVRSISLPRTIKTIGEEAFRGIDDLENIYMNEGLLTIGRSAFRDCRSLQLVEIPGTVARIEDYAFHNCMNLRNVFVREAVEDMGQVVFDSERMVERCAMDRNEVYDFSYEYNGVTLAYKITGGDEVCVVENKSYQEIAGTLVIPPMIIYGGKAYKVTAIASGAFKYCWYLREVYLPEGLNKINGQTFAYCSRLQKIILPESLETICNLAFNYCARLKEIDVPKNVTTINDMAFSNCCLSINVRMHGTTPPTTGKEVFTNSTMYRTMTVPIGSVNTYKNSALGKYFWKVEEEK